MNASRNTQNPAHFALLAISAASLLAACQTKPPPPAAAVTVAFELAHNEIILDTAIGGSSPQRFLLDCGVDPSVIDITLARSLGIAINEDLVGEATGAGEGEGLAVMESSIPGLKIGGTDYPPVPALAADISGFSNALGFPLAGILGHSFLDHRVVRIDYPARQVTIADSREALAAPATAVSNRFVLPLTVNSEEDLTPVFELVIDGQPVTVTLDTGSSGGLDLFPSAVARLGLEDEKASGEAGEALGARGTRQLTKGVLHDVGLGPFVIADLDTTYSEGDAPGDKRSGNAGNKIFQNFVLTLDYVNDEIVFEQ